MATEGERNIFLSYCFLNLFILFFHHHLIILFNCLCVEGFFLQMSDGKYLVAFRTQIKTMGELSETQ